MKVPWQLHMIAFIVVTVTLAAESVYLFYGTPGKIPDIAVGRILGTLDLALGLVLGFYFTASISQHRAPQRISDSPVIPVLPVVPTDPPVNKGPTS